MLEIYVYTKLNKWVLLDLYEDESIPIEHKLMDLTELEKAYSLVSKEFSVPASSNNNLAFDYYFDTNLIHQKIQYYDCQIHVGGEKYKTGRLAVMASKYELDTITNYSLSFSTGIAPIKEKIGDDTLAMLDFSTVNFTWNLTNVRSLIYGNNSDVIVPLISVNRMWNTSYSDANNIITNGINVGELRPAIRVMKLIQMIEQKYQIKINFDLGAYNNSLNKMFIWCNKDSDGNITMPLIPQYGYSNQRMPFSRQYPDDLTSYPDISNTSFGIAVHGVSNNTINNEITITIVSPTDQLTNAPYDDDLELVMTEVNSNNTEVLQVNTLAGHRISNGNYEFLATFQNNVGTRYYRMELRPKKPMSYTSFRVALSAINLHTFGGGGSGVGLDTTYQLVRTSSGNTSTGNNTSLKFETSLDYPIIDFLSSLVKMFNIKIIEDKDEIYKMTWKNKLNQNEVDLTNYVDFEEIKKESQIHYKKVKLSHEESDYLRNVAYQNATGRVYGTEEHISENNDLSEEYEILTGINVLSYFALANSNIITSYGFDDSFKPVNPDTPTFFFRNEPQQLLTFNNSGEHVQVSLKFGSQQMLLSNYTPVSNIDSFDENSGILSLTFNNEPYPVNNEIQRSTLYSNFYNQDFLQLYSNNVFVNDYTAYLPSQLLKSLSIENTVIIADKKFSIYEMEMDIKNGKTDLKLIDFYTAFENVDDAIIVTPPALFFVMDYNTTEIQIGFNGSTASPYSVALHRLQWKESSQPNWGLYSMDIPVQTNNQVSYTQTITGLFGNTNYDIRIQTIDTQDNWSEWIYLNQTTENVEFITVLPPTNLILETGAFTALHLSFWGAVSQPYGIQSYKVEWKLSNASQYSSITIFASAEPMLHSITGLQSNRSYDVRVKTIDTQNNESAYITRTFNTQGAFLPMPPGQVDWQVIQPSEDYTNVLFTAHFDDVSEFESLLKPHIIINLYQLDNEESTVQLLHPIDFTEVSKNNKQFDFTVWENDDILLADTMESINIKQPSEGQWSIEVATSSESDGEISEFTRIESPITFPLK